MKILLFGSIAAGKTTIAKIITKQFTDFKFIGIDNYRCKYGNGTMEGEKSAQKEFVKAINKDKNQIIEASGLGTLGLDIYETMAEYEEQILLIILHIPVDEIKIRIKYRTWNIPFPGGQEKLENIILSINLGISFGKIPMTWSELTNATILQIENRNKKNQIFIIQIISNYIKLKKNDTIRNN
ncbi:MAG: hypothetical protein U9Q83_00360 [Bacteroidota bacterium]|nr:hypothetical protein [Bacteroidota bacterium]